MAGLVAEEELSQATVLSNWQQKLQAAKDELAELVVSEAAKQKAVAAQQKRIAKCHARVQKLDEEIKLTRDMNATLVSDQVSRTVTVRFWYAFLTMSCTVQSKSRGCLAS